TSTLPRRTTAGCLSGSRSTPVTHSSDQPGMDAGAARPAPGAARPAPGAGPQAFRATLALLASAVTVISAHDPDTALPRGMTANAVMSASLDPPLIVVSVRRGARLHDVLERAGEYAVTVLGEGQ